jgi:F-type H+-transporting ATPase subunit gamma
MPSLKAIRKRIASVKSTQKITRAMKLVSAARLRRAQEQILAARPYARALMDVIAEIAMRAGADSHPLLGERAEKKILTIVVTSDRGMAGAYNSNVTRQTERFAASRVYELGQVSLLVIGKKGKDALRRRQVHIKSDRPSATSATALGIARELAAGAAAEFVAGKLDAVYVIYNEFKNAASQKVHTERLLPVTPRKLPAGATPVDYLYEPSKREVLDRLLPLYVEVEIYRCLLEAIASEFGARMSAMENATVNADEIIARLTLNYNRARQAAITKELSEIIGGSEALNG